MAGELMAYLRSLDARIQRLEAAGMASGGEGSGVDADQVDSIHAATTATANKLLALDASAKLPASITGDADTVDSRHAANLLVTATIGSNTGTHTISGTGSMEDDATLTVSVTVNVTSTVLLIISAIWASDTAATNSFAAQAKLGSSTAGATGYVSCAVNNAKANQVVIARFTGVTAGKHNARLQVQKNTAGHVVTVVRRFIMAVVLPE